jgi:dockerin type I repeat protein
LRNAGHIGFAAHIDGPGMSNLNNYGLFVLHPDGQVQVVARRGDPFDVSGDGSDVRIIFDLDPGNMNNSGEIVFKAIFTDGTVGICTGKNALASGDASGDGTVNIVDLLIVISSWGACSNGEPCPADFNADGVVNVADLLIVLSNWS